MNITQNIRLTLSALFKNFLCLVAIGIYTGSVHAGHLIPPETLKNTEKKPDDEVASKDQNIENTLTPVNTTTSAIPPIAIQPLPPIPAPIPESAIIKVQPPAAGPGSVDASSLAPPLPSPSPDIAKGMGQNPMQEAPSNGTAHAEKAVVPAIADRQSIITKNMPGILLSPRLSQVISLEQAASQILLTDPKIADVQLPNPYTMYVYGRTAGVTEIIITTADGQKSFRYHVKVRPDFHDMSAAIQSMLPATNVRVTAIPDGVLLQGVVDTPAIAEDIRLLAKQYVGQAGTVISQLKIKNASQVNLRVKVAEVQRKIVNRLGINWSVSNNNNIKVGLLSGRNPLIDAAGNFLSPSTADVPLSGIGARIKNGVNDFTSMIDALAQEQLATILAEPNLVTSSGEEASFLVGGEFPYPIAQGTGTNITITYQFKQYGISLAFLPIVIDNKIVMRVRTEISDLDSTKTIRDSNGNAIPSIRTRRAESTLEMGNGQSMVLAGLLSESVSTGINAIPGLADIPILGALFKSNDFQSDKTELVIVVTPYNVEPIDEPEQVAYPTDGLKFTNLMDMFWRRQMTRIDPPEPTDSPPPLPLPQLQGESGFYF